MCRGSLATVVGSHDRNGAALRTVACEGCGLVWVDPRPFDSRQFYEQDYRRAYKNTFEPRPRHVLRAGRVALDRWSRIKRFLRPGMRVLDVGSGGGEFSYLLTRLGLHVVGVEPNVGYAQYAQREYALDIRRGFIGDVELEAASRDLVTIWHVLEHTEDPGAVLRKLRHVLAAQGLLVVEVPNIEATCQSPRSTFHAAHLYHFNVATLQALASCNGLQAIDHRLSPDGGNLTMVFRAADKAAACESRIEGNHERVTRVLAAHRPLRHLLRPATALRTIRRLAGALDERLTLWKGKPTGKVVLDELYDQALRLGRVPESFPALRLVGWAAGAVAAAWWLECELVDDAHQFAWTTAQGTAIYFALLASALVGAWLVTRRRSPKDMRLRLGGLSLILALMPVLH
ncbi:bifunctional 2-polyprenyl-6-hydroxyphenol methylase/3-demethylubiquinol 3-O-methyltransferase UbiG [Caenimonas sp. SL110]|uniref:class I SAM-dependent methyltransferase n=1 Tax=Caenimonas sp. SL110 TaxID=1450524 RepID=UPI001930E542|nr:methyltransferase domain-containing protein [Caenimonas sp. SL110]